MDTLIPVPEVVTVPGYRVRVHVPLAGKLLKTTLPVDRIHVGAVIVPTIGAAGVVGCAGITALVDAAEVHPTEFVTVKLYVPLTRLEMVLVVPVPVVPPGLIVHVPLEGNPFRSTDPVDRIQVGAVIVPTVGVVGVAG